MFLLFNFCAYKVQFNVRYNIILTHFNRDQKKIFKVYIEFRNKLNQHNT